MNTLSCDFRSSSHHDNTINLRCSSSCLLYALILACSGCFVVGHQAAMTMFLATAAFVAKTIETSKYRILPDRILTVRLTDRILVCFSNLAFSIFDWLAMS